MISQWYEMWTAGGCQRGATPSASRSAAARANARTPPNPSDADEVARMALERAALHKADPSKACGLVTRINVMIPDLPGLGVFRLDTGSFYAAGESGDKADLMEMAREHNVFLPANAADRAAASAWPAGRRSSTRCRCWRSCPRSGPSPAAS